jgi:hypothetical protein
MEGDTIETAAAHLEEVRHDKMVGRGVFKTVLARLES